MTAVNKQDSNTSGLRFAELVSGALPVTPTWLGLEPNSYKNFGASFTKVSRSPINASRQRKKGVVTDLTASGGFQSDLTYENMQGWIEGLFFADFRTKGELAVATIASDVYEPASGGAAYKGGDLLWASGFADAANNGLHPVSGTPSGSSVTTSDTLVDATTQTGKIVKVGHQLVAGDAAITVSGSETALTTVAFDMTSWGLIPGEWIYIGGDAALTNFTNAANTGFVRVVSVTAHKLIFDKAETTFVAETISTAASQTVRVFFGRVVKNEIAASDGGAGIVKRQYEFERTLGAPDDGSSDVQAEYLLKSIFNEWTLTLNTADKVTWDTTLVAAGYETKTAGSQKSGTRPGITEGNAYNTTSHVRRFALEIVGEASPLFAFISDGSLTINNNVKPNKAIKVLGAFDQSAGDFQVGGTVTAYFQSVTAVQAVPDNSNCTLDLILAQDNQGIAVDYPLVGLGNGLLNIAANEPITLPLDMDASTAASIDPNKDYTAMMVFFDYLPDAAM